MTQEFHVSVTPVGNDRYLVRTERVAPGVPLAEEQVNWAVEDWLAQARQLMNNPLQSLLQGDRATTDRFPLHPLTSTGLTQSSLSLVALGQQLYSAIFQGTLRDSWVTAQGIAQHRGEALRLRLGVKGALLPRLPWEVFYSNDMPIERVQSSLPLASGINVIFSRYQPGTRLVGDGAALTIEPDQPLRILMVISAPTDQERLELQREVSQLQQELRTQPIADGTASPDMQLTILNQPGREQLTQALEQGQYQVLHYAGHSDLGVAGGSLYLVNNRTGLTEILSGDDLAGLLVNNGVRLAVFNSCRGAYTAAEPKGDRDRNLAEALVSRGIPAVLAMAEQIPDNVALTLTWLFYRNLKQGYPIDLSLSRARQGLISTYGSNQLYWALPILYQHPDFDGYLTPGDRNFGNPADRLVLMPHGFSSLPVAEVASLSDLPPSAEPGEEEMVWNAVLEEDDLGDWADDLEYPEESDEEDAELVADLLGQLTPRAASQIPLGSPLYTTPTAPVRQASTRQEGESTDLLHSESVSPGTVSTGITLLNPSNLALQEDTAAVQIISPIQPIPAESSKGQWVEADPQKSSKTRFGSVGQKAMLPLVGAAGALAIALLSYWLLPQAQWVALLSKVHLAPALLGTTPDLQNKETKELTTIASDRFNKGRLPEGEQALGILLDRGALLEAAAIIQSLPAEKSDVPGISYLRGRLAWQSIQSGDPDYQLSDAVRDWESAAKAQPNLVEYQQALGFAYYAQNRPREAIQAWTNALDILEIRQKTSGASPNQKPNSSTRLPSSSDNFTDRKTLTIYAGIALALRQVVNDPAQPQTNLSSKASKIYQMVLRNDPVNFQPQALNKNWLWSESAIKDWQTLAQES